MDLTYGNDLITRTQIQDTRRLLGALAKLRREAPVVIVMDLIWKEAERRRLLWLVERDHR